MKKTKIIKICVMLTVALLIGTSIVTARQQNDTVVETQEELEINGINENPLSSRLYQCLIICGLPWVIIITTLAFVSQGMAYAQALVLAGATITMVICVILCITNGESNNNYIEPCPCE